jgi:hypothetical protein
VYIKKIPYVAKQQSDHLRQILAYAAIVNFLEVIFKITEVAQIFGLLFHGKSYASI